MVGEPESTEVFCSTRSTRVSGQVGTTRLKGFRLHLEILYDFSSDPELFQEVGSQEICSDLATKVPEFTSILPMNRRIKC